VSRKENKKPWRGNHEEKLDTLRRRIQCPAQDLGIPAGRYCFLPRFLDIPNLYCDLLQVESLSYKDIRDNFKRIATLDVPYAEAVQNCFTRFYATVGLPVLNKKNFSDMMT
jgi:hypothetical protein